MSRSWPWLAYLLALGTACSPYSPGDRLFFCQDDSQCGGREVCFADGCGDPGSNIVVEVTINPALGLHAQDIPVTDLRSPLQLELAGPSLLQGAVQRESPLTDSPLAYTSPIALSAQGYSLLLPGQKRRYTGSLTPSEGGYQLAVGSGEFTVSLVTEDSTVPPMTAMRSVGPAGKVTLDFLIPAAQTLTRLEGQIFRRDKVPVGQDLQVQALDGSSVPLSQVVRLYASEAGRFTLYLPPAAAQRTFFLKVSGMEASALVPEKIFSVEPGDLVADPGDPRRLTVAPLELGDYGEPVEVSGQVVDVRGRPLEGVTVKLQGTVAGDGLFLTYHAARTDAAGRFTLRTLPSAPGGVLMLLAQPPPGASAGVGRLPVSVPPGRSTTLPTVVCPDRIRLQGTLLLLPHDKPLAGMRVQAVPMEPLAGWILPEHGQPSVTTNADGQFTLMVDPGHYRLDFLPNDPLLARASRFITVELADRMDSPTPVDLGTFLFSNGRQLSGSVVLAGEPQAAASVRFFRVGNVQGKPLSIPLAEALTDINGRYTVMLPTR